MSRNRLIAVVDDDPGMCDAIGEMVEALDFDSARFLSAEGFLAEAQVRDFDCLVTDIRMPGTDGFELARRVAQIAPALPVILISSIDDEMTRRKVGRVGGTAFLRKPCDAETFLTCVTNAMDRG
ncbi:response regulator [Novosphingobium kaempferiae]|uniref:response regulator n=1 Tax=Novosphingobium kaempferiae TaxID=2896849 RepID=UPI001E487504|nr:response regulator [Novosphingobium kaempferiae]